MVKNKQTEPKTKKKARKAQLSLVRVGEES